MRKLRIILAAVLLLALTGLSVFLVVKTREERKHIACTGMNVNFLDSLHFVTADEIKNFVLKNYGVYVGQPADSVKLCRVEEMLTRSGLIVECNAWMDAEGSLQVDVRQRQPVLRFMNGEKGFYVDAGGYVFPLHKNYVADVTVVEGELPIDVPAGYSGYLEDPDDRRWIEGMLDFRRRLLNHRVYGKTVEKLYIRGRSDLAMKLSTGNEVFILGEPEDIAEKFSRIEKYYHYIAPAKDSAYYKSVNLKYKNQIICRTKDI